MPRGPGRRPTTCASASRHYLEQRPARAGPDARADPVAASVQAGDRISGRAPGPDPAPAGRLARRRPDDGAVLRPARPDARRARPGALVHRAAPRPRRAGRPGGHRLARRACPARSTGPRATEPMGVRLRRRFGVDPARSPPTRTSTSSTAPRRATSAAARSSPTEIERPRVGPMRDIVATIQPEQDEIVRADVGDDGMRPGRARHRQDRRRPAPSGLAALRVPRPAGPVRRPRRRPQPRVPRPHRRRAAGPRRGGGRPHDGRGARRAPVPGARRPTRPTSRRPQGRRPDGRGPAARGLVARAARPTEPLVVPRGVRKWRVPAYEVDEIVDELRDAGVRYERGPAGAAAAARARRARCRWRQPATRRTTGCRTRWPGRRPVRAYVDAVWPTARPAAGACSAAVDRPRRWPRHADGVLTADEQRCCSGRSRRGRRASAPWSRGRRGAPRRGWPTCVDRTPSLGHVVLDEAQDLSPMQLRAVGRRCSTGSATVLGDIAQGTTPVGDRLVGVVAGAPRQAGRPRRGARPRVPRAGVGHRLRRPAAAARWRRAWARRCRCARTRAGSTWSGCAGGRRRGRRSRRSVAGAGRGAGLGRRHRAGRPGRGGVGGADRGRHRRTACSAPTTGTSTTRSTSCRPPWPRAWSSTGSSSSSRRPSPPTSRTSAPGCGGSTSCSPEPSRR